MGELVFRGIQVNEIDMSNELQGQVKLDIEQRASFNVKYTQDMKHCIATCVVDMMNKNAPNDFNFKISVRGNVSTYESINNVSTDNSRYATYCNSKD